MEVPQNHVCMDREAMMTTFAGPEFDEDDDKIIGVTSAKSEKLL